MTKSRTHLFDGQWLVLTAALRLFPGSTPMQSVLATVCLYLALTVPGWAFAQTNSAGGHEHGAIACNESPTPGKRPPNIDCAALVHVRFSVLPPGPLVW